MTITAERILFGSARGKGGPEGWTPLAFSPRITPAEAGIWRGLISVQPLPLTSIPRGQARAYGVFAGPNDLFGLACAYYGEGEFPTPYAECLILPRESLAAAAGNLMPLLGAFERAPGPSRPNTTLSIAELPPVPAWSQTDRIAAFEALLHEAGGFERVLRLLAAALNERGVILYGYPEDSARRVRFVQGLMALLPASLRPDFTFSTNRHEAMPTQARIVFAVRGVVSSRWPVDWEENALPAMSDVESPAALYLDVLQGAWQGDIPALLRVVDAMNAVSVALPPDRALNVRLAAAAERYSLDARLLAGEDLPAAVIKNAVKTAPPVGELKTRYAERLFAHALESRDAEAALIVASLMDADPALDERLGALLDRALSDRPDAVYAFVRARLSAGKEQRWLIRLRAAALASLKVAIADSDTETLLNWLRLVAREPASYGMAEIVHNGILAAAQSAQKTGYADPELVRGLTLLAIKRDPAAAQVLLADPSFLNALPNSLGAALRDGGGDPAAVLQAYGVETLLAALARAAEARQPELFTPFAIEQLIALYTGTVFPKGHPYSPEHILSLWASGDAGWLPQPALQTLLTLLLRDKRDDLFYAIAQPLRDRSDYLALLTAALTESNRSSTDILAIIAQMAAANALTQQETVDLFVRLLDVQDYTPTTRPLFGALARLLQQVPTLTAPQRVLWALLEAGERYDDETALKVALRRLEAELANTTEDAALVDGLARLVATLNEDVSLDQIETWWRSLVRSQSLARLQKLDKALDGLRELEPYRAITGSALAFRRLVGKRTLAQFADDVATTFNMLQALSETYDPAPKRSPEFDAATLRAEIDMRRDELTPQQLQILANNLKALAALISEMGDSRTKASLIRRGEDIDRALITGQHQPHSAVDTLKWLSGYLSGAQETENEEE